MERFTGSFTQQEPIPDAGIEAAIAVLRHGRIHRYNTAAGEIAETALLEEEFAELVGAKYCLAVASGGYAMACALRAVTSTDGMTAEFYPFDMGFLGRVANRIVNEVRGINRVTYDITSKPPGTIEWE